MPLPDFRACQIGLQYVRLADLLRRGAVEYVAVDEDEVGHMAGLERAQPVLGEAGISAAAGEGAEGLLQRQPLLRHPAAGGLPLRILAADRRGEAWEGVGALDREIGAEG